MLHRLLITATLGAAALGLLGCLPSSSASSAQITDPRPVALSLHELPVGFVTREALFTTGRQYRERFQLAPLRTQAESGGLSEVRLEVTSHPALEDAEDALTVFRDEDAAMLLVSEFVRARNPSSRRISVEAEEFPLDGVDEASAYLAEWEDADGHWAAYSVRFRVDTMTAWVQAVTRTDDEGEIVEDARPTARALMEVQARKMRDAQD